MARRFNIIIVPDDGGKQRSFRISQVSVRILQIFAVVTILAIAVGGLTYGRLARQALDYGRLKDENTRLENENRRVILVAREVDQSRQILAQIVRALGGHLELGRSTEGDTVQSYANSFRETRLSKDAEAALSGEFDSGGMTLYEMPTLLPVNGFVSQGFFEDYLFPQRSHRGIDIAGKSGIPITAAAGGRVVFESWTPGFGNCMVIAHQNGYITIYGHNSINLKSVDQDVKRGEVIALLGTSGKSSAPHLHFEIWKDGVPVDPLEFVKVDSSMIAKSLSYDL